MEKAIMRVQKNQDGFKLNGTHQFLIYADVTTLRGRVFNIVKNTKALVVGTKDGT
jgi:hypothetical protein